jgi:hypothetical protein
MSLVNRQLCTFGDNKQRPFDENKMRSAEQFCSTYIRLLDFNDTAATATKTTSANTSGTGSDSHYRHASLLLIGGREKSKIHPRSQNHLTVKCCFQHLDIL